MSRAARQGKGRSRPVSRVLSWTVIPLGASSPIRSSNLPGDTAGRGIASLFGLAPGGVCRAGPLPDSRCALTAPFHPCLISEEPSAVSFCCTFRRLSPPRRYLAPCPVEPGLSSAPSREGKRRDCPADSAGVNSTGCGGGRPGKRVRAQGRLHPPGLARASLDVLTSGGRGRGTRESLFMLRRNRRAANFADFESMPLPVSNTET